MRRLLWMLIGAVVVLALGVIALVLAVRWSGGYTAKREPSALETRLARALRGWAIPRAVRDRPNPVPSSPKVIAEARAHFADHCAVCHANNGSGESDLGRIMYPRPPDLRHADTQNMTDGEIFHIIEEGVPLTGMAGFGSGHGPGEELGWGLVRFIRHLPRITSEELKEMERLNPKSPHELQEQQKAAPESKPHTHSH
jgi:mono/diheme cytochrome c family protein